MKIQTSLLFCDISRTAENHSFCDVLNRGAAAQLHGQFEIFAQQIQDAPGTLLAVDGQAPNNRAADPNRLRRKIEALFSQPYVDFSSFRFNILRKLLESDISLENREKGRPH